MLQYVVEYTQGRRACALSGGRTGPLRLRNCECASVTAGGPTWPQEHQTARRARQGACNAALHGAARVRTAVAQAHIASSVPDEVLAGVARAEACWPAMVA